MTTINDISDLVQILQDHPEWKNTIRGLIIGEELAQLPERFTRLEQTLADFIQATNRNFELVHARLIPWIPASTPWTLERTAWIPEWTESTADWE